MHVRIAMTVSMLLFVLLSAHTFFLVSLQVFLSNSLFFFSFLHSLAHIVRPILQIHIELIL